MSKSALSTKLLHAIDRIELDLDDDKSVSILKGVHINLCALERENETLKAQVKELEQKLSLYEWKDRYEEEPPAGVVVFLAMDDEDVFLACESPNGGYAQSTLKEIVYEDFNEDFGEYEERSEDSEPRSRYVKKWMKLTPPIQEGEE